MKNAQRKLWILSRLIQKKYCNVSKILSQTQIHTEIQVKTEYCKMIENGPNKLALFYILRFQLTTLPTEEMLMATMCLEQFVLVLRINLEFAKVTTYLTQLKVKIHKL